jgi:prepilin-type N-terminal cleavage/methylation domain-containing protein
MVQMYVTGTHVAYIGNNARQIGRKINMVSSLRGNGSVGRGADGFTLAEVVVTIAILAIVIEGVVFGYIRAAERAEWSAHSLAAQALASQAMEQVRAAKWYPQSWPAVDEMPPADYQRTNVLDFPSSGSALLATNFISITTVSVDPPLRQVRTDCVWRFFRRGLFTNTLVTLRAPDQ